MSPLEQFLESARHINHVYGIRVPHEIVVGYKEREIVDAREEDVTVLDEMTASDYRELVEEIVEKRDGMGWVIGEGLTTFQCEGTLCLKGATSDDMWGKSYLITGVINHHFKVLDPVDFDVNILIEHLIGMTV